LGEDDIYRADISIRFSLAVSALYFLNFRFPYKNGFSRDSRE